MLGISTLDHLKDIVNRQRAAALYYSIAAGFLYAWLILPTKGEFIINFIMLIFILFLFILQHLIFSDF